LAEPLRVAGTDAARAPVVVAVDDKSRQGPAAESASVDTVI
jgi:hypothetical protein